MAVGKYFSQHSGEDLDRAIRMVIDSGLDNLEHDKGIFTDSGSLPKSAKEGDFAFVGTNLSSMTMYSYHSGWRSSGVTSDLSKRDTFDALDTSDTTEYNDVF